MQSLTRSPRKRDERGAYSVMFALLSIVMFGIAALAVDLGSAFSRKSDVQGQADFAALSGGQELTSSNPSTISLEVLAAVAESMNLNQPTNGTCTGCVTTAQLANGVMADGEVELVAAGLKVTAPASTVDYGFAGVIGQADKKDVQASATVQIKTLGNGAMPMYAAAGCDYGPQTLADPASGHVTSAHENLAFGDDSSSANIWSITDPSPASIALTPGIPGPPLTVTGTDFVIAGSGPHPGKHVSKIGFFRNDGATVHEVAIDPAGLNDEFFAEIAAIPAEVAGVEDVWWVRVHLVEDGATPPPGEWSPEANAKPLTVGSAQLECDSGSTAGNFGTLRLPRDGPPTNQNLPLNIAVSFDEPLSLEVHEEADASGHCADGVDNAIESYEPNQLRKGTNCVGTDTGLAANAAAAGLVEGVGSTPGRLRTATLCGSDTSITLGPRTYTINGDSLECFLTSGAVTVNAITAPSYNGGTVLSEEIYSSPRFFWVPVLASDAVRGASERYSIIDFRPAFLTDLHVQGTNIDQLRVTFFNWHALPSRGDGPVIDYLGTGPKVVRMVD
jgi:hypothetical protein